MTRLRLEGRRALVTGGGRGIGRGIVEALVEEGAHVLTVGRTEAQLQEVTGRFAGCVHAVQLDLLDAGAVSGLAAHAERTLGGLDLLVNNAGVWIERPFEELTRAEWDLTLGTNLTAAFEVTRVLLPSLLRSNSGRIINIAAIDGEVGFAKLVAQCASKFGLVGFTKALAKELWDRPITVNAICPAEVDKGIAYAETPLRTPGPAKALVWDVARAVVYLASPEGVRITGVCLDVHGVGFLAA